VLETSSASTAAFVAAGMVLMTRIFIVEELSQMDVAIRWDDAIKELKDKDKRKEGINKLNKIRKSLAAAAIRQTSSPQLLDELKALAKDDSW
jgi:hypothetical protein